MQPLDNGPYRKKQRESFVVPFSLLKFERASPSLDRHERDAYLVWVQFDQVPLELGHCLFYRSDEIEDSGFADAEFADAGFGNHCLRTIVDQEQLHHAFSKFEREVHTTVYPPVS